MNRPSLEERIHLLEEKILQLETINKLLQNEVITDPLTQAYNRRSLESILPSLIAKAKNEDSPFSLIMLDVDYFKEINDSFGHLEGDRILKNLVQALQNNLRKSDWVVRFGGEEFLVLLPATREKECKALAERLRASVQADYDLQLQGATPAYHSGMAMMNHVTISLGAATYRPGDDSDTILRRTDSALYYSKKNGRNLASYCKVRAPLSTEFLSISITSSATQAETNDRLQYEKIAPIGQRLEVLSAHPTAQII